MEYRLSPWSERPLLIGFNCLPLKQAVLLLAAHLATSQQHYLGSILCQRPLFFVPLKQTWTWWFSTFLATDVPLPHLLSSDLSFLFGVQVTQYTLRLNPVFYLSIRKSSLRLIRVFVRLISSLGIVLFTSHSLFTFIYSWVVVTGLGSKFVPASD